jgi:hypothetical protein
MTRDPNGQLHAGTIGLFDEADERDATSLRDSGRAVLLRARYAKKAETAKHKLYSKHSFWANFRRFIMFRSQRSRSASRTGSLTQRLYEEGGLEQDVRSADTTRGGERRGKDKGKRMYDVSDVDWGIDSPFYDELGLVRIRANNARDVKVVCRRQVWGEGALDDYGE